jgi:ABC-2 type transport system ATP-binding protein
MSAILVKNLTKVFKKRVGRKTFIEKMKRVFLPKYEEILAVNRISFEVGEGEIVGLLGPNGAGKTTLY